MSKANKQTRRQTKQLWALRIWAFVGMFALLLCPVALAQITNTQDLLAASVAGNLVKTASVTFPPHTEAEQEMGKMLNGDIDLALVNWLVAADISEFKDMTRDAYFKQLTEIPTLMTKAARGWNPHYDSGNNISVLFQWSFP